MTKDVLRLAGLLAAVALATSRLGLIAHEVVAHGGVALAAGAEVTEVRLFWFAGGWIRYALPAPTVASALAITLAGIALEVVVGLALVLAVRGDSLGRRLVRGVGTGLFVHATWYLAVGTFNGFGDGVLLYRLLGDWRIPVALAAGVATCTATYLGTCAIVAPLARTLAGSTRRRAVGFAVAALLGGGLHATLTLGELKLRSDGTYAKVMQPERDRRIASELVQWQREQAARGAAPSDEQRRVERARLEREHATFPFVPLLAVATALALIAGLVRTRGGRDEPIASSLLLQAIILALASIVAVIVFDALLPG